MIRSIITLSALGFALAGCSTGEVTNQQAPRPVPAPVVAPAPAVGQPIKHAPAVEQSRTKQAPAFSGYTCEPNANARFDNPTNPNELTNKSCGYTDTTGQERSNDPWIEGQLQDAQQRSQQQAEQQRMSEVQQENRRIEESHRQEVAQQYQELDRITQEYEQQRQQSEQEYQQQQQDKYRSQTQQTPVPSESLSH